ncbi:hypothetical protein GcM1_248199 [Golovinomyces cichoracearum]|uniref:Chromo domain-containing protein n=1 Tax=Golovinomyces cichoracearum TaxID=62708 RepID=A0A420IDB8_9PEZI|nr:hypothetical protein GcM1_248199 [Golovinomyces cichoracearum]
MVYVDTRNWQTERLAKKFDDKYAGPWPATRVFPGSKAVEVRLLDELANNGIFNLFHPNLLRLYVPSPVPLQEPPKPQPVIVLRKDKSGQLGEECLVDEVVDCKKIKNKWKYRVKWTGDPGYQCEDKDNWINNYDVWSDSIVVCHLGLSPK